MAKKKKYTNYRKRNYNKGKVPFKKWKNSERDFSSPEYRAWRDNVKKRDKHRCQWPGCCSNKSIQVHHIKTWANYPAMRFVEANGITLCKRCHDSIRGKEADYEFFFMKVLEWQMLEKIKKFKE
jgi:5-methylcytosine-specific restriction endonuclease McrA